MYTLRALLTHHVSALLETDTTVLCHAESKCNTATRPKTAAKTAVGVRYALFCCAAAVVIAVMPESVRPFKVPLPEKLAVGACAGVFGTCCVFPIDVVKTRMQMTKGSSVGGLVRSIYAKEGMQGFYRGLLPNLTGVTPEKAIKLAANEYFREQMEDENGNLTLSSEIAAGAGAGFCQVVATNPMEIVKIRMQMQAVVPAAERSSTISVVRSLGIAGVYRGSGVTLLRDVPYSMLFFPLYANVRHALADKETGKVSKLSTLTAGCISGAVAAGAVTPADMIKTRYQAQGGKSKYGSVFNCARIVIQKHGWTSLFDGAVPRMSVQAPLFAIALLAFEVQKEYLIAHRQ